ncbi:hypothetical protein HUJ04_007637 [Dendroctonus ponderosae]
MQSQPRKSGLYFNHQSRSSVKFPSKPPSQIQKSSVSIQTDIFLSVCDLSAMSVDEIKEQYSNTLKFLNNCHEFINSVFRGQAASAHLIGERSFDFRAPEVPNYFSVLEVFLARTQTPGSTDNEQTSKSEASSKMNFSPKVEEEDEQILFDLKQFLPKLPNPPNNCEEVRRLAKSSAKILCVKSSEDSKEDFHIQNPLSTSPSRLVRSGKDIIKPNGKDMKALSSTFREILKTCNEFENKSIEYLIKNDVPLNEPPIYPKHTKKATSANPKSGDQKPTGANSQEENQHAKPNPLKTRPKGFNLLEYALRSHRTPSQSSSSAPSSPRLSNEPSLGTLGLVPNREFFLRAASNIYSNFQVTRQSMTVLNQAQCRSPKRVNEMFKKISRETIKSESNEDFTRFIEYDDSVQGWGDDCEKDFSSCESVILNDEEFQKRNLKTTAAFSRQKLEYGRKGGRKDDKFWQGCFAHASVDPEDHLLKCNPLKLTDKDKSKANEKVLRTIGLFTEKGEIRPGVISILEEKQRQSLMQNRAKNVQFRTERKFDLEVRFNNQMMDGVTSEESFGSERNLGPPTSMTGHTESLNASSSSTVGESDIMKENARANQALIKKCN